MTRLGLSTVDSGGRIVVASHPSRPGSTAVAVTAYRVRVARWELWRQDDNGDQVRVSTHEDRIEALARLLALQAGPAHKQTYWLSGPPGPVCRTNRDLYLRLLTAADRIRAAGRSLDEFLRAWLVVGKVVADRTRLDLDTVAAMVTAAATVPPPPLPAAWRTASHPDADIDDASATFDSWQSVIRSQVADLADLADQGPLDQDAYFGIDLPRPLGRRRATARRWYNFDPHGYLECGMAGTLGGWDTDDGQRVPVPGPVDPTVPEDPGEYTVDSLTWADLTLLAIQGQRYE
ncbi:MAG: hypothetical protein J2P15_22195 [Micromonosporaceae bacterium]|nr:hypothetical protein [Micromonosporaceae bacterium]